MINSNLLPAKLPAKPSYPYLGVFRNELVVLFIGTQTGIVVKGNSDFHNGRYSTTWGENQFETFTGQITLSNI
jgi:hypothetical protein